MENTVPWKDLDCEVFQRKMGEYNVLVKDCHKQSCKVRCLCCTRFHRKEGREPFRKTEGLQGKPALQFFHLRCSFLAVYVALHDLQCLITARSAQIHSCINVQTLGPQILVNPWKPLPVTQDTPQLALLRWDIGVIRRAFPGSADATTAQVDLYTLPAPVLESVGI